MIAADCDGGNADYTNDRWDCRNIYKKPNADNRAIYYGVYPCCLPVDFLLDMDLRKETK